MGELSAERLDIDTTGIDTLPPTPTPPASPPHEVFIFSDHLYAERESRRTVHRGIRLSSRLASERLGVLQISGGPWHGMAGSRRYLQQKGSIAQPTWTLLSEDALMEVHEAMNVRYNLPCHTVSQWQFHTGSIDNASSIDMEDVEHVEHHTQVRPYRRQNHSPPDHHRANAAC